MTSYPSPLDHNLIGLPFVATEDAETLDEVFRAKTEEELERTYTAVFLAHVL